MRVVLTVAAFVPLLSLLCRLDSSGEYAVVASGAVSRLLGRTRRSDSVIRAELADIQRLTVEKAGKLRLAEDSHVGLELLHLFVTDLLGRDTPVARIFNSKAREE
jgi:hypothetical protein